jgi:hypothetical protein
MFLTQNMFEFRKKAVVWRTSMLIIPLNRNIGPCLKDLILLQACLMLHLASNKNYLIVNDCF